MESRTFTILITLFALIGVPAVAQDSDHGDHGRVSFADDGGLVKGVEDDAWSHATVNTIVLPSDIIWADEGGSMEIEAEDGVYFRLADGSKAEIVSLPPEAHYKAWTGSFYLHRTEYSRGEVILETPVASIDVAPNTQVRVDVLKTGATTVTVRWGKVDISTGDGRPITVTEGHRSYVDPGYRPSTPVVFATELEDDFDTWNRERARLLAYGHEDVPVQLAPGPRPLGLADLNAYGEWHSIDGDYAWAPSRVADFVPYRHGHWSYVPAHGHVWIGHHPFSYITSHHGYWTHHDHHGWIWRYHHKPWHPAWAFTVRYGDHFVWTPIDHHHRPVIHGSAHFDIGGVHFSIGATSFSHARHLLHGPAVVHPFHPSDFRHISHHNIFVWNILHHRRHARFHSFHHGHHDHLTHLAHRFDTHVPIRHFTPDRILRGPLHAGRVGRHATDRANRLERNHARDRFEYGGPRDSRGLRTRIASTGREANLRRANVRSETLTTTHANVGRAERGRSDTSRFIRTEGTPLRISGSSKPSERRVISSTPRPTVAPLSRGSISDATGRRLNATSSFRSSRTTSTRDSARDVKPGDRRTSTSPSSTRSSFRNPSPSTTSISRDTKPDTRSTRSFVRSTPSTRSESTRSRTSTFNRSTRSSDRNNISGSKPSVTPNRSTTSTFNRSTRSLDRGSASNSKPSVTQRNTSTRSFSRPSTSSRFKTPSRSNSSRSTFRTPSSRSTYKPSARSSTSRSTINRSTSSRSSSFSRSAPSRSSGKSSISPSRSSSSSRSSIGRSSRSSSRSSALSRSSRSSSSRSSGSKGRSPR